MESEKILNVKTKRFLQKNGQTFKKYLLQGYILNGNELLPPEYKSTQNTLPDLNEDVLYHILYNADFNTLKNYCSSKKYHSLCQNKELWIHLFDKDQLKLFKIPTNSNEWIKEYQKIYNLTQEAKAILNIPLEFTNNIIKMNITENIDPYFNQYINFLSQINHFNVSQNKFNVLIYNFL